VPSIVKLKPHTLVIVGAALVLEPTLLYMLVKGAPVKGVPRDPRLWLRFGGSLAAILHAPAILFNGFICSKMRVPSFVLWTDSFITGFAVVLLLLFVAAWLWRALWG
jgi:hypothetical protein